MEFVSFLPNLNFYFNTPYGNTFKFRITKMTKCYITIHQLNLMTGDIMNPQRIKIRKDKESDYIKFKITHNYYLEMSSDKVNYTDEI